MAAARRRCLRQLLALPVLFVSVEAGAACGARGAPRPDRFVRDIDGNDYPVVNVGSQVWLAENLRVTRTPEGVALPAFPPNGDPRNVAAFGRLYDWESARQACPAGWRLPTDADWSALEASVGANAGLLLRDPEYWPRREVPSTDLVHFGARPAGYFNDQGFETYFGTRAVFWTATPQDSHFVWSRGIIADTDSLRRAPQHPQYGFSVRCVSGVAPQARPEAARPTPAP
jgi:uncharacterized protein (TIGR02145 family)